MKAEKISPALLLYADVSTECVLAASKYLSCLIAERISTPQMILWQICQILINVRNYVVDASLMLTAKADFPLIYGLLNPLKCQYVQLTLRNRTCVLNFCRQTLQILSARTTEINPH